MIRFLVRSCRIVDKTKEAGLYSPVFASCQIKVRLTGGYWINSWSESQILYYLRVFQKSWILGPDSPGLGLNFRNKVEFQRSAKQDLDFKGQDFIFLFRLGSGLFLKKGWDLIRSEDKKK
jgi:hypothetical protein